MKLADAQDEIYRLKIGNATLEANLEMYRIRVSAMEGHIRDLERVYQMAIHQNIENSQ